MNFSDSKKQYSKVQDITTAIAGNTDPTPREGSGTIGDGDGKRDATLNYYSIPISDEPKELKEIKMLYAEVKKIK